MRISQWKSQRGGRPTSAPDVLFLGYDNCLHRCDAYVAGQEVIASVPGIELFEYATVLERLLEPYPDVRIVLSSDWVEVVGFERARDALPRASLRERVIGATRVEGGSGGRPFSNLTRGEQILRYVAMYGPTSWLALDDRLDGFESCRVQLVHCQAGVGLGDNNVQKMLDGKLRLLFYVHDWR